MRVKSDSHWCNVAASCDQKKKMLIQIIQLPAVIGPKKFADLHILWLPAIFLFLAFLGFLSFFSWIPPPPPLPPALFFFFAFCTSLNFWFYISGFHFL